MNERANELIKSIPDLKYDASTGLFETDRRALYDLIELTVKECIQLNKTQYYDLLGVIIDTEDGEGFDLVCLNTVKRVAKYLGDDTLAKHFGVDE